MKVLIFDLWSCIESRVRGFLDFFSQKNTLFRKSYLTQECIIFDFGPWGEEPGPEAQGTWVGAVPRGTRGEHTPAPVTGLVKLEPLIGKA